MKYDVAHTASENCKYEYRIICGDGNLLFYPRIIFLDRFPLKINLKCGTGCFLFGYTLCGLAPTRPETLSLSQEMQHPMTVSTNSRNLYPSNIQLLDKKKKKTKTNRPLVLPAYALCFANSIINSRKWPEFSQMSSDLAISGFCLSQLTPILAHFSGYFYLVSLGNGSKIPSMV